MFVTLKFSSLKYNWHIFSDSMSTAMSCSSLADVEDDADAENTLLDSADYDTSLFTHHEMTRQKTLFFAQKQNKKSLIANCWKRFGFLAAIDKYSVVVKRFDKLVSCRTCFLTYSFKSNSTRQSTKHNCKNELSSSSSTDTQILKLKQFKIISFTSSIPQHVKLNEY